jgi:hypothetical protein
VTIDALCLNDGVNVVDVIGLGVLSGGSYAPETGPRHQDVQDSLATFPCHKLFPPWPQKQTLERFYTAQQP